MDQVFEAFDSWERTQVCIRGHVRVVREEVERLVEQFEVTQAALREAVLGFIGYAFPDDEPDDIVEEVISGFIQSGQLRLIAERGSNPASDQVDAQTHPTLGDIIRREVGLISASEGPTPALDALSIARIETALGGLEEQLEAAHGALRRIADAPARKDNFDEILIAQRTLSNPASEPDSA